MLRLGDYFELVRNGHQGHGTSSCLNSESTTAKSQEQEADSGSPQLAPAPHSLLSSGERHSGLASDLFTGRMGHSALTASPCEAEPLKRHERAYERENNNTRPPR